MGLSEAEELEMLELEEQEHMASKSAPKISQGESAYRGGMSGLSLDFDDEIAGALSVAGRPFGIKGLGGQLSDIELAAPTLDSDEILGEYGRVRDSERALKSNSQTANPSSYLAGQVGGGVLNNFAIPGLSAAKGAKLAANAGKGALQGGIAGLGMSEEEDLLGMAKDTAAGAGLGAGGGVLGYGLGKAIEGASPYVGRALEKASGSGKNALSKAGRVFADVPEEYTQEYLKRGGNIAARTESEILDDLTSRFGQAESGLSKAKDYVSTSKDAFKDARGQAMDAFRDRKFAVSQARGDAQQAVASRFAQLKESLGGDVTKYKQAVLDDIDALKQMVSRGSQESYDILDNDPNAYGVRSAASVLNKIADDMNIQPFEGNGLAVAGSVAPGGAATPHTAGVQSEIRALAQKLGNTPERIPARELKKILQQIDDSEKAIYNQPGFDSRTSRAYKLVRGTIDDHVKAANPEYAEKMKEVSENTGLLSAAIERFGSESKALGRLGGIGSTAGREIDLNLLKRLGEKTGSDFETPINQYLQNQDTLSSPQALTSLKESLPEYQQFKGYDEELTSLMDPAYARSIDDLPEVAGASQKLSAAEEELARAQENYDIFAPVNPSSAQAKLRALTGARDYNPKQIFEGIDKATGHNFSTEIKDRAILDSFNKTAMNGSRRTLFGSGIGAGVGGLLAGPIGASAGASIGGAAGFAADKYAGKIFKSMLDGSISADQAFRQLGPKLGKYASVFEQAAQRGPQGVASTHFLLQQTEPDYRMLMDKIAGDDDSDIEEVGQGYRGQ